MLKFIWDVVSYFIMSSTFFFLLRFSPFWWSIYTVALYSVFMAWLWWTSVGGKDGYNAYKFKSKEKSSSEEATKVADNSPVGGSK